MNYALLVGINKYSYKDAPELFGCINDIDNVKAYLMKSLDFKKEQITVLTDGEATRDRIASELGKIVAKLKKGDRAFFQFSGHGAKMPPGKDGKVHDTICPYNFDWKVKNALQDSDFYKIFGKIPQGSRFIWVSDSCNSGNLTRMFLERHNFIGSEAPEIIRAMPAPLDIRVKVSRAISAGKVAPPIQIGSQKLNLSLLTACGPNETASDATFGKRHNGAFTHYLLEALGTSAQNKAVLSKILDRTITAMHNGGYPQTPELKGADKLKSKPLF